MQAYPQRKRKFAYDVAKQYQATKRRRTIPGTTRAQFYPQQRIGYGSVPRTRGASVTGEMKYFDTELSGTAITTVTTTWPAGTIKDPAVFLTLCVPTVGAAINQRVGREIKVMKIKIKGTIYAGAQAAQAAADNGAQIRYILCMDMQTNAAAMTGAQLLTDGAAAENTINAFQNLSNFGRFKVLKDKTISLSNTNMAGSPTAGDVIQSGFKRPFKCNVNFKEPVRMRFNATNGGTIADIIDNSFHFLVGQDNVNLAATVAYTCRVAYKE